jgi:hypothetical protein
MSLQRKVNSIAAAVYVLRRNVVEHALGAALGGSSPPLPPGRADLAVDLRRGETILARGR